MSDISFNIAKDVNLNKVVNLEINKNIDVNVEIDDLLATAEADAEAFGKFALAETDAYTYVRSIPPEDGTINPGAVNALGNIDEIIALPDDDGDGAPDMLEIIFDSAGDPPPDVDDINGFGHLEPLSSPPPATPDVPLPDPLLAITDLKLNQTGVVIDSDNNGLIDGAQYSSDADWVVNFGERTLDLGKGETTAELLLTVPAGSLFLAEFVDQTDPFTGRIRLTFEDFVPGGSGSFDGDAFFTFAEKDFVVNDFVLDAITIQTGIDGIWIFLAASDFFHPGTSGDGEAFAYAESTSAVDLNGDGSML